MSKAVILSTQDIGYKESFVNTMNEFLIGGLDFEGMVRLTLNHVLGETPSETFLMMMDKRGLKEPKIFVAEASLFFGEGARSLCAAIMSRAMEAQSAPVSDGQAEAPHLMLVKTLLGDEGSASDESDRKQNLLHNHRVADELGGYASDYSR